MSRKNLKTNPILITLIHELKKKAEENDTQLWKDIALRLEKPSRNWAEVNLGKISKNLDDKEIAVVPGKVLSTGNVDKKIKVAAWDFSDKAIEKIEKAGGKHMNIKELLDKNPKGENVRIMG
ncbi:MAG: 50S ribosomal protein L18e [Candidatus Thermoplasmatota archaeon]